MTKIVNYNYNSNSVAFEIGSNIMINATEMAKPFNKSPLHFLRNQSTKQYIKALENRFANSQSETFNVINGGNNSGTWMHKSLALRFAQWLSPEFAIWIDEKIEELLTTGKTEIVTLSPMEQIAQSLQLAQNIITKQEQEIKQLSPKAEYCEEVLESSSKITTTIIAKELGMSARKLNKILEDKRVQYNHRGTWVLYSNYHDKGYTDTYTHSYNTSKGNQTKVMTVWTESGRKFIHNLLSNKQLTIN